MGQCNTSRSRGRGRHAGAVYWGSRHTGSTPLPLIHPALLIRAISSPSRGRGTRSGDHGHAAGQCSRDRALLGKRARSQAGGTGRPSFSSRLPRHLPSKRFSPPDHTERWQLARYDTACSRGRHLGHRLVRQWGGMGSCWPAHHPDPKPAERLGHDTRRQPSAATVAQGCGDDAHWKVLQVQESRSSKSPVKMRPMPVLAALESSGRQHLHAAR